MVVTCWKHPPWLIPENPLKPWRIKNDGFYQTKPTCILHLVISQNISPNADFPFKKSHPIQILTRFGSGVLGMGDCRTSSDPRASLPSLYNHVHILGLHACSRGVGVFLGSFWRISTETLGNFREDLGKIFWESPAPRLRIPISVLYQLASTQHPTTCSFARENQVKHGPCFAKFAKVGPTSTTRNQQNMIWGELAELATFTSTRIVWEPHVLNKCWKTLFHSFIWKALISYYPHKHVKLKAEFSLAKSEWFMKTLWMTVIWSVHSPPFIVHPTVGLNTANN